MKRRTTWKYVLAFALVLSMAFAVVPTVFAEEFTEEAAAEFAAERAEVCEHQNIIRSDQTKGTAAASGDAYKKCADCGYYARVVSGVTKWQVGTAGATLFKYYEEYTLNYAYTIGGETNFLGTFRVHSISNDYYEDLSQISFNVLPPEQAIPIGYRYYDFSGQQMYMVLINGRQHTYHKNNNSASLIGAGWLKDPEVGDMREFTLYPAYLLAKPLVSIEKDGQSLRARIANSNENLAYSYVWSKNDVVLSEQTGESILLSVEDAGSVYTVTVTVVNAENSSIVVPSGQTASAVSAAYTVPSIVYHTITFDTNGATPIASATGIEHDSSYTFPSSPLKGFSQAGWYLNGTDTLFVQGGKKKAVTSDLELIMKRAILAPGVSVTIDDLLGYWNGKTRTFTSDVKENEGLTYQYQWYKDGSAIEAATEKTLTVPGNVSDSGVYKVVVTATKTEESKVLTTNNEAAGEASYTLRLNKIANTLFYYINDGSETAPGSSYTNAVTIVIREKPQREGYTFLGWNTKPDGSGVMYQPLATYPFAEATDNNGNGGQKDSLYAQWKKIGKPDEETPPAEKPPIEKPVDTEVVIQTRVIEESEAVTSPKTGDNSEAFLTIALFGILGVSVILLMRKRIKDNK